MALNGKINLFPLYIIITLTLMIGYISSLFFYKIAGMEFVHGITEFGSIHIPIVKKSMVIAADPTRCAFVMTVQWMASFIYAWVFFIGYCPLSSTMRVATKRWYISNPLPSASGLRCILFLLFGLACLLGDFGILNFPTFLNGEIISYFPNSFVIQSLINSKLLLPIFSWFTVLAYVTIYWVCLFLIVNRRILFN